MKKNKEIEFLQSQYGKENMNCLAFYLGILQERARKINRDKIYVMSKEGKLKFKNFNDIKSIYVKLGRILINDNLSERYKQKISDYFMKITKEDYPKDDSEMYMCMGVGMAYSSELIEGNYISFREACDRWGINDMSTLRKAKQNGKLKETDIIKKSNINYVLESAMTREYGEPKQN